MDTQWSLDTHGDPLGRVRDFIGKVWSMTNLEGMLVSGDGRAGAAVEPRFITDIALINDINPFTPLMELNAARMVPGLLASHPNARLGALMRPCEMRALSEMSRHVPMKLDNLVTLSVDCLGTLPADEYQWRLERIKKKSRSTKQDFTESTNDLADEALQFARQGGIVPYRYRPACQVCSSPAASQATVNIHILGLPVRQHLLVEMNAQPGGTQLDGEQLADGKASQELIIQFERTSSKMSERHQQVMERVNESLGALLPADVDALISQLENCGDCQSCMEVCPICSVDRPARSADGHYDRLGVMRWLLSCAGCGMCEQSCPDHLPLAAIFSHIRHQLAEI